MTNLTTGMKGRILQGVVIFVIVCSGVVGGAAIAAKFGLISWYQEATFDPGDAMNRTALKSGQPFPSLLTHDSEARPVDLQNVLDGKKTLIGVVSNGCEACIKFVDGFREIENLPSTEYQIILLTMDTDFFRDNYPYPVYEISSEFVDSHQLSSTPTVIGVTPDMHMAWVISGYSPTMTPETLGRFL